MKKVLIIGISGTGKTTLAKKLSASLRIPAFYLDTYIWKDNWVEASQPELEEKIKKILPLDSWIMEGFISPCAELKLERASTVLYLDYSGWRALLGGLRRWWQYRGRVRPEMPAGCVEKLDWKYLKVIFKKMERPEIETAIANFANKIVRLKSPRETKKYLNEVLL